MSFGKVTKVLDGDTFKIKGGTAIRLSNVRAPEIGTKGAAEARHALEDIIQGKTINFQPVGISYNRKVANVKVGGKSVNQAMRNKGYTNKGR